MSPLSRIRIEFLWRSSEGKAPLLARPISVSWAVSARRRAALGVSCASDTTGSANRSIALTFTAHRLEKNSVRESSIDILQVIRETPPPPQHNTSGETTSWRDY